MFYVLTQRRNYGFHVEAVFPFKLGLRAVGDERVWPPELHVRADLLAEPARDGTVLDAHDLHARRALLREELAVKRLQVPRVHRDPADARRDLARLPVPVTCRPDREAAG